MSDPVTRLKGRPVRTVGRQVPGVGPLNPLRGLRLGLPWLPRVVQAVRRDAGRTSAPVPPP